MIVIETNLKILPKKCNKCKYSYFNDGDRFCAVSFKDGLNRCCPYDYNEAKRNYEYSKPNWCPLRDIEPVGSGKYSCEVDTWPKYTAEDTLANIILESYVLKKQLK